MVFFPNERLELWEYYENENILNGYGEPKPEYNFVGVYECDFQPMTPKDSLKEYGEILEDGYKIYLNIDVPITSSMILRLEGKPETYTIVGTPIRNNHNIVSHIKVVVQKERKPTKVNI